MKTTTLDQSQQDLLTSALSESLKLTPEERIEAHEKARQLVIDLQNAGKESRAGSKEAS